MAAEPLLVDDWFGGCTTLCIFEIVIFWLGMPFILHQSIFHGSLGGLNAAAVGLLVPTMFVVYDTLQAACCWQRRILPEKTHWFDQVE